MGIDLVGLRALQTAKLLFGADLNRTIMLGRQEIRFQPSDLQSLPVHFQLNGFHPESHSYSEPLFKALGAKHVDSIDASDYEDATICTDFNLPLPQSLCERYTFYCDFGSMEHILDTRQVVLNCSALLRAGGKVLVLTNCNSFPSHGFYQFSPEFFYSVFSSRNGFDQTGVFVVQLSDGRWFHVEPPAKTGRRSRMAGLFGPCYVVCFSQKTASTNSIQAMQSDYALDLWETCLCR